MKFYGYVDRVGAAPYRQPILVSQSRRVIEAGVEVAAESSDMISPDQNGVFSLDPTHPNHEARTVALKAKMKRVNLEDQPKMLVGPSEDYADIRLQQFDARPKTGNELAAILTETNTGLESENAALRKKIAALQKK